MSIRDCHVRRNSYIDGSSKRVAITLQRSQERIMMAAPRSRVGRVDGQAGSRELCESREDLVVFLIAWPSTSVGGDFTGR
jgi:hypothetical protein